MWESSATVTVIAVVPLPETSPDNVIVSLPTPVNAEPSPVKAVALTVPDTSNAVVGVSVPTPTLLLVEST